MRNIDLMVGDLVTFKDCQNDEKPVIVKVMELHRYDDLILASIDGDKFYDELELDDEIVGIPLTPEILEKNGFSNNYIEDDLSYAIDAGGNVIGVHIVAGKWIMDEMYFNYVHELQHALRLCGIDKEITL